MTEDNKNYTRILTVALLMAMTETIVDLVQLSLNFLWGLL